MLEKLNEIKEKYGDIEREMARPDVVSDQNRFKNLNKEYSRLQPVVYKYDDYLKMKKELDEAGILIKEEKDPEMRAMLQAEIEKLETSIKKSEEELLVLLLPKDPNSGKDIIMEIRAGTGGDEAALFAADLFRMYSRYIDSMGWVMEPLEIASTGIGGYKEIIFSVKSGDAYDYLKYESGVHRVQRIPVTEAGGRIHTSAVTVAVMVEAEESDVKISPEDVRIDVYRSSGHGGQSVNTTDSAVRITHIPTGIVVTCQDEKSQHKNKAKALRVLRSRLLEKMNRERQDKEAELRKSQVGSGDRSERIRTYNFPQSRVTDHRIGMTMYSLESFISGEIKDMIEALKKNEISQILAVINK
ncbi:MAG: peptide chain release factor 1 [Spirochaetes bacterium]|jgi:peptide chain release factor 1|nr:peptide chain release factor 1 [Spirochaetota bacterium]